MRLNCVRWCVLSIVYDEIFILLNGTFGGMGPIATVAYRRIARPHCWALYKAGPCSCWGVIKLSFSLLCSAIITLRYTPPSTRTIHDWRAHFIDLTCSKVCVPLQDWLCNQTQTNLIPVFCCFCVPCLYSISLVFSSYKNIFTTKSVLFMVPNHNIIREKMQFTEYKLGICLARLSRKLLCWN